MSLGSQQLTVAGFGDSGSWVITPKEGCVFGMLIAGSTESRIAYIVPATRLFNDILSQWPEYNQRVEELLPSEKIEVQGVSPNTAIVASGEL